MHQTSQTPPVPPPQPPSSGHSNSERNYPLVDTEQHSTDIRTKTARNNIHALPNELLTSIFSLACPLIDFNKRSLYESGEDKFSAKYGSNHHYLPITLGAVCRHWREIVFHFPEIWSACAIEAFSWDLNSQIFLLRLYLENAGPHPFTLDLDLRSQRVVHSRKCNKDLLPSTQWQELQPLTDLIFFEFPEKIQKLYLAGAPPRWVAFLSEKRLPQLLDLSFVQEDRVEYEVAETPEEVAFITHSLPASDLPPLTSVHLCHVCIDICVDILLSCPHLTEYYCYDPMWSTSYPDLTSSREPFYITEPFSLPNLRRFGWTPYVGTDANIVLLKHLLLPNLEELIWCGSADCESTIEEGVVFRFFYNLPETLYSITYDRYTVGHRSPDFHEYHSRLLLLFPQVGLLAFQRCTATFIESIFHLLCDYTHNAESSLFLPRLSTVIVARCANDGADLDLPLVEMLEMRRSVLEIPSFGVEFVKSPIVWSEDVRERLRKLEDELDLSVAEKL